MSEVVIVSVQSARFIFQKKCTVIIPVYNTTEPPTLLILSAISWNGFMYCIGADMVWRSKQGPLMEICWNCLSWPAKHSVLMHCVMKCKKRGTRLPIHCYHRFNIIIITLFYGQYGDNFYVLISSPLCLSTKKSYAGKAIAS
jgi:hypothetical protein